MERDVGRRVRITGHAEPVKGAFHGLAAVVCGLMFAYNTIAWLFRREPHLAMNALVYGTAILYEGVQTHRHIAARVRAGRDKTRPQDGILSEPPDNETAA